eukprot:TRINITY_DN18744_c2_g1_i2.p2 TRINITY_DN18744_c2_g1~~TRINITY_DN18744_c2_g1_i2.p2  ORF type:complete len:171 (-),score=30.02 TRINITY_DN18744_c2_g1_i2:355-846(-)
MSTRRRHLLHQKQQHVVQVPSEDQKIVQAISTQGGNVVEVAYPDGSKSFCLLPTRFNKTFWIRRGGYLIISELDEQEQGGNKIRGMVESVLYDQDIKQLKKMDGIWPPEFDEEDQQQEISQAGINQVQQNDYLCGSWLPDEDDEGQEEESNDNCQQEVSQQTF